MIKFIGIAISFLFTFSLSTKAQSVSPTIRGGVQVVESTDPGPIVELSVLYHTKSGISFGPGVGITKSQVLNTAAIPAYFEVSGTSKNNSKLAPILSLQAGYLIGKYTTVSGKTTGSFMTNVLGGVKMPQKGKKYLILQIGYSLQNFTTDNYQEKRTDKFNGFIGMLGISL